MSAPSDGRGTTGTIFRVSGAHPPSSCADVVLRRCDIFPHTTPPLLMLLLLLVTPHHPHNGYNTATIPVSCFSLLRCCAVSLMQLLLSCALCAIWVWVWGFLNTGSAEDGAQKCGTKCQMRVIKRCFSCRQDTGLLEDFYSDKKRNMQEKKLVSIWRQNVAQCAHHTPQYTTSLHCSYHNGNLGCCPVAFW